MRTKLLFAALFTLAALGLAGCGSDLSTGVNPTQPATLKLVVDTQTDLTVADAAARTVPWDAGVPDSLIITSGKFVVRSLKFTNVTNYTIDNDISASDEARDQSDPNILYRGPYVLSMGSVQTVDLGTVSLPVGDYNAVSLVLHEGKSTDDLGGNTDMVGRSVRVTGFVWYGKTRAPFDFQLNLQTELLVQGNFTVPTAGTPQFVVKFDVGKWFRFGDNWLDPNKPESLPLIYQNIQRKLQGGRDYDGDGRLGN